MKSEAHEVSKQLATPKSAVLLLAQSAVFALLATPLLAQRPPDCSTLPPTIQDGLIIAPQRQECVLRVGDVFSLIDDGMGCFSRAQVSLTGTVREPLMGELPAEGLTVSELELSINEKLLRYVGNPHVSVLYDPSGRLETYWMVGSVERVGIYIATPMLKLSEALRRAAVLASRKKRTVKIIRAGGLVYGIKSLNSDTDILIEPGD